MVLLGELFDCAVILCRLTLTRWQGAPSTEASPRRVDVGAPAREPRLQNGHLQGMLARLAGRPVS